ncbi:MAG: hypothetical protein WDM96_02905 [Lacunisphaera sp.]
MTREAGCTIEVLAAQDGPLRSSYEALGAHITVVDTVPLYLSPDEDTFHQRLGDIKAQVDWDWRRPRRLQHAHQLLGHPPRRPAPASRRCSTSTRARRSSVSSSASSSSSCTASWPRRFTTRRARCFSARRRAPYYADLNIHDNFRIVPSWIRLDDLAAFARTHDRASMRRKHGFGDDETIIANIGTVCERKGQHVFLRAIEHFNRQGHRGKFRFVMVGARPGIYTSTC